MMQHYCLSFFRACFGITVVICAAMCLCGVKQEALQITLSIFHKLCEIVNAIC